MKPVEVIPREPARNHVLLINQFFRPDFAPTGQLLADLAEYLDSEDHDVTVICSDASYAGGGESSPGNVNVIRVRTSSFSRIPILRILSYLSFFVSALYCALRLSGIQVVVTMTTPPFLPLVGTIMKRLHGVSHLIWVMDMYPDVAVALGKLRPRSPLTAMMEFVCDYALRTADAVIAIGECMRERLIETGISASRIHVVHNWADSTRIKPCPKPAGGSLHILYAGNVGLAHDVETVLEAALRLRDDPRFRFTFSGGGARRQPAEAYCNQHACSNVTFQPYRSAEDLNELLGSSDIGLITQLPQTVGLIVPSKLYSLMAAGRPILFIGPRQSAVARAIQSFRCGWQIDCGDVRGLVTLLEELHSKPLEMEAAGLRARQALLEHFDLRLGVSHISTVVRGLTATATDTRARPTFVSDMWSDHA